MSDHGTNSRYTQGCRCTPCRGAHAEYRRNYRRDYAADTRAGIAGVDRDALSDLLNEWFPDGLTSDSPAGRAAAHRQRAAAA